MSISKVAIVVGSWCGILSVLLIAMSAELFSPSFLVSFGLSFTRSQGRSLLTHFLYHHMLHMHHRVQVQTASYDVKYNFHSLHIMFDESERKAMSMMVVTMDLDQEPIPHIYIHL